MKANQNSKRSIAKRQRRKLRHAPKSACFVYGLRDSIGAVRYVGQTRTTLQTRAAFHRKHASANGSPVQCWLMDNPVDIFMIDNAGIWDVSEIVWIERLRASGEPLLNCNMGGKDTGKRTIA